MERKVEIKRATEKDLICVSKILKIESAKKPYSQKWTSKTAIKKMKEFFSKGEIYFAIADNEILGFVVLEIILEDKGEEVVVKELWVKLKHQRKGIGKNIMKFVEDRYLKRGIENIFLLSDKESGAFAFYKKLGYSVAEDTVLMDKRLKK